MWQWAKMDNSTVCYREKQMDVSFSCVCPVIDNEFHHNIVKVVCRFTRLSPHRSTATLYMYFDNVLTDARKTDVNFLKMSHTSVHVSGHLSSVDTSYGPERVSCWKVWLQVYLLRIHILSINCFLFPGQITEKMARENNFLNIVGMVRCLFT